VGAVLENSATQREELEVAKRRDWSHIIDRLNESPRGELRIRMGSPGSAQVTRCRLLEEWSNLEVTTVREILHLRLKNATGRRSRGAQQGGRHQSADAQRGEALRRPECPSASDQRARRPGRSGCAMDPKLFLTVFGTIFLAEIGDKTQLATMLYAADASHPKWTVFAGAASALVAAAAIGILAGGLISQYVEPRMLSWIAGAGFIAVGIWTILRA